MIFLIVVCPLKITNTCIASKRPVVELSNPKKSERQEWYVNIFNDMGSDWEAIVNMRDTQKEAVFVERTLPKEGVTLDLCCGTGRHAIALRKRGWRIVGMDLSRNLLAIAKLRMMEAGVSLPLIRADMRYFPFRDGVISAIMNMYTSFGYLPSETEDIKSLRETKRILEGNGKFLLDLSNRDHMVNTFKERDWAEFEPFYLLEKRSLDLKSSKLKSSWTLIRKDDGRIKVIQHEVRLYTFARIEQLLKEAGLTVKEVYGGYEKQEFTLDTSRMIVIAQKG